MTIRRCGWRGKDLGRSGTRSPKLQPTWVRLVREPDPAQSEPIHIRGPQDVHRFLYERASQELVAQSRSNLWTRGGSSTSPCTITLSSAAVATCRSPKRDYSNQEGK